ncbi:hypothetical protein RRG08_049020 [Elysia crispata]|uniref:Reverse transcriptase domain-containing protein n=1 Tax=Elysia crispata TaxID=231223 RepID=A0AAE0ZS81_9GAST|nr:hypothetical protein RRG08_049020 [Elysia crispata]
MIGLVVEIRKANEAIIRERHPIPTVEDVLQELNRNAYFSELNFRSEYYQIELEENSRNITTFVTLQGLSRYKRLFFGVNSAIEKFQNIIEQVFSGMEGVRNISDNMTVLGKDEEEYDRRLESELERLAQVDLKLNKEKCKFRQTVMWCLSGIRFLRKKLASIPRERTPCLKQENTYSTRNKVVPGTL